MEPQLNVMASMVPCVTKSLRYRTTINVRACRTMRYRDCALWEHN